MQLNICVLSINRIFWKKLGLSILFTFIKTQFLKIQVLQSIHSSTLNIIFSLILILNYLIIVAFNFARFAIVNTFLDKILLRYISFQIIDLLNIIRLTS